MKNIVLVQRTVERFVLQRWGFSGKKKEEKL